jgi:hypothetical protein
LVSCQEKKFPSIGCPSRLNDRFSIDRGTFIEQSFFFLIDLHRALRSEKGFSPAVEFVAADRRIRHRDFAQSSEFVIRVIASSRIIEHAVNMIFNISIHGSLFQITGKHGPRCRCRDRQRVPLAFGGGGKKHAHRIELVGAEFRH